MSMVAIRRRIGERVYLLKEGMPPIHVSAYFSTEGIPPKTEITLNIEAPADVVIEREEKLTCPIKQQSLTTVIQDKKP